MKSKKLKLLLTFILMFTSSLGAQDISGLDESLDELLNTKISTAAKYDQKLLEVPASTTIITSEEIGRFNLKTMSELLNFVRGFYIRNDRNYEYFGVRGFDRPSSYCNNNLVLLNGHIMNENIYWQPFIGNDFGLNLNTIERVEIIRGPGSALYGAGAMLSVINIITKKGIDIDGINLTASYGSFEKKEVSFYLGKELFSDIDFTLSGKVGDIKGQDLYYSEFDTLETNNGWAEDLDWEKYYNIFSTFSYKDLKINMYYNMRTKGIPTAPWVTLFNNKDAQTKESRAFLDVQYLFKLSANMNFKANAYLDYYLYEGKYPYEELLQLDGDEGFWIGGELQYLWDISQENRLIAGIDLRHSTKASYYLKENGMEVFNKNYPYTIYSFYIQDQYQFIENFILTFGIRHDQYNLTQHTNIGSSTTPRFSLVFNPTDYSALKLIFGQAFRTPNLYESEFNDSTTSKENHHLNPEKIHTTELVYEQEIMDCLFLSSSVYYYKVLDLIDQYKDPKDSLLQFINRGHASGTGFDVEISYKIPNGLYTYVNYSYNHLKDEFIDEKLSNSPTHILNCGFSYIFFSSLTTSIETIFESERITVYRTETEPYFLANLAVSYQPNFVSDNSFIDFLNILSVSLKIKNLFDNKYYLPGGNEHLQNAILQDGLNYLFELNIKF